MKSIEAAFAVTANCPGSCSPDAAKGTGQPPAGELSPNPPQEGAGKPPLRVGPLSEISGEKCTIVTDGNLSIGVYKIDGVLYAIRNQCPHQGAPLCRGEVGETHAPSPANAFEPALAGRVIRCPWHGWEFDIPTGKGLYDAKARVKTYATFVDEEGIVWIRR